MKGTVLKLSLKYMKILILKLIYPIVVELDFFEKAQGNFLVNVSCYEYFFITHEVALTPLEIEPKCQNAIRVSDFLELAFNFQEGKYNSSSKKNIYNY